MPHATKLTELDVLGRQNPSTCKAVNKSARNNNIIIYIYYVYMYNYIIKTKLLLVEEVMCSKHPQMRHTECSYLIEIHKAKKI